MAKNYSSIIGQFKRSWNFGKFLSATIWTVSTLAVVALVVGFIDYAYALPKDSRLAFFYLVIVCFIITIILTFILLSKLSRENFANLLDRQAGKENSNISDALSLEGQSSDSKLHTFLKEKALSAAQEEVTKIPLSKRFPWKSLRNASISLLTVVLLGFGIHQANPAAFRVVSKRLSQPKIDTPPYSTLEFKILNDSLEVVYGEGIDLTMHISGDEIKGDVSCLLKNNSSGEINSLGTIKKDRDVFVRSLSSVTEEMQIAFTTGNARSQWYPINVLLQPKITSSKITITPPAYTNIPSETYDYTGGDLRIIQGSQVKLTIQSNRPLSGGTCSVEDLTDLSTSEPTIRDANSSSSTNKSTTFEWQVINNESLTFYVKDIRNIQSADTIQLKVISIEDQAPEIDLASKAPRMMATPDMAIPLQAEVSDDFDLRKVSMVRTLIGYRERAQTIADSMRRKVYDYQEQLELTKMGVEPGQVLELYVEAHDHNPSLLGVGISDPLRILIISHADYAQRLRDNVTLKNFTARYKATAAEIDKARKALEELKKALDSGDEKAIQKAKENAIKANENASSTMEKIANDFKAFDMEGRLSEIAKEAKSGMDQNTSELKNIGSSSQAETQESLEKMMQRLGGTLKKANKIKQDAELVKAASTIMEMTVKYRKIYNTQKSIMERLITIYKQLNDGITGGTAQLEALSKVQARNKKELEDFKIELKKRAEALPEELTDMKHSALEFLEMLETIDPESPMNTASIAAKNGDTLDAVTNAQLAKEMLEQLMNRPKNGFCEACQGTSQKFQISLDVQQTMEQMLEALCKRGQGNGGSGGSGGGIGGTGSDGSVIHGFSSTNIPVLGPDRLLFENAAQLAGGAGDSKTGSGSSNKSIIQNSEINSDPKEINESNTVNDQLVPLKYKDAVKRYFKDNE